MVDQITSIDESMVTTLQALSATTFTETFGKTNSATNIERHNTEKYSVARLRTELANPESHFVFIYHDHQLAGYLKVNRGEAQSEPMGASYMEVERIYILVAFKGLGLGRQLMEYAFKQAHKWNLNKLWLGVWEHNDDALTFYKKLGYYELSDHVFTLGESQQRDLIMAIEL